MAEGEGFEPSRPRKGPASFQDWYLQPLGHPSVSTKLDTENIVSSYRHY